MSGRIKAGTALTALIAALALAAPGTSGAEPFKECRDIQGDGGSVAKDIMVKGITCAESRMTVRDYIAEYGLETGRNGDCIARSLPYNNRDVRCKYNEGAERLNFIYQRRFDQN